MARIRTIKPEFWTDSFMVHLPPLARLLYIALWTAADDHGYVKDEPERLAMEIMPKEDPVVVDGLIQFFIASGRLEQFVSPDGDVFLRIASWEKHQRIDKPTKSKLFVEGSRKLAIPQETRVRVAEKYKCPPGGSIKASCFYCGSEGEIVWHALYNGKPSRWVTFPGLELEHFIPESQGGSNSCDNIVLACRNCNRTKGTKDWIEALCSKNGIESSRIIEKPREYSTEERKGKEGKGKEGKGSLPGAKAPEKLAKEQQHKHAVVALWCECFKSWKHQGYVMTAADKGKIASLAAAYSENRMDLLKSRMLAYLKDASQDRFGWTFAGFEMRQNNYVAKETTDANADEQDDAGFFDKIAPPASA